MIRSASLVAGLALALAATSAFAAGAREDLASFTSGLKGLQGRFTQQVYAPGGQLKETASGTVALSTPRLFRWEYAKPYAQLILADGRKVWNYEPDLEQVTVREQGVEEQNHPLTALFDPGKLDARYEVKELGTQNGLDWLSLTPKGGEEAGFESARLGFGAAGLAELEIVDAVGQKTRIRFSSWSRNPAFPRSTFKYSPPKGVDVIGEG